MTRMPIGGRIREARKEKGLTQAALAQTLGISPAYLNLIEHDRRAIGGALLKRIAERLEVSLARLSGVEDAQLAQDIMESARSLSLGALDDDGAAAFVMRHPDWAGAFRSLHRRYQDASEAAHALSDRLSQDPQLMELSHALLTQITAVRAFAEILEDFDDLGPEERLRFAGIISSQSDQLGSTARTIIRLLEGGPAAPGPASPLNEVDDFILNRGNHFPELEEAAEDLGRALTPRSQPLAAAVAERLENRHDIVIRREALPRGAPEEQAPEESGTGNDGAGNDGAGDDGAGDGRTAAGGDGDRLLRIDPWASEATARFQTAARLAEIEFAEILERLVDNPRLKSAEARVHARRALANYAAAALLFPYERFLAAAEADRYDLDRLALRFSGSYEQVAHRLVTLRRPGAEGVPFAYLRADPAGNVSKPFSIAGLRMPRLSGACPLWALYEAFATPGRSVAQLAVMPQGERFLFFARRVTKQNAGHDAPPKIFSIMLGCEAAYLDRVVYGDAFASGRASLETPVGVSCRSCPRAGCPQRAHPMILPSQPAAGAVSVA